MSRCKGRCEGAGATKGRSPAAVKVSEWSVLAGEILAGRQERVREYLEDTFGALDEMTVGEFIEMLEAFQDEIESLVT